MHVYFIQGQTTRLIKIGQTRGNVYDRLDTMQIGSPDKLKILKAVEAEKGFERSLHIKFDSVCSHGEWFYPSCGLMAFIDSLDGIKVKRKTVKKSKQKVQNQMPKERPIEEVQAKKEHRIKEARILKERRIKDAKKMWEQGFSKGEIESELGLQALQYLPSGHNPKYERGKRAREAREKEHVSSA